MSRPRLLWAIWILVLGISLTFIHTVQNVQSFSEYLQAFLRLDMPASWCPTFLTLYGASTLLAGLTENGKLLVALSRFAGLVLLPVGLYATYTFTLEQAFSLDFIYLYAQSIHISEVLTGVFTVCLLAGKRS